MSANDTQQILDSNGKPPAIQVQDIVKRYGDFEAVKGVSFSVADGEIFGLLGPNGAGKSTLIRMMTTLIPLTSGKAMVAGHNVVEDADAVRRLIGVIPQALTSDPDLTVGENLSIYAKLYSVPKVQREKNIQEVLEAVDLVKWRDAQTKTLSGGMRRRLEIARGLVHNPQIFFLDEPTTGLDPVSRVAVWEMLARLKHERDLTILVTTHYMDEADKLCDRIAIVDHGKLVALDSPIKLKASVPGKNILEVSFAGATPQWLETLKTLPDVAEVKAEENAFRLSTENGPRTTVALIESARAANVTISTLSIQSTTLDDVFVYYTGRQLRDALQSASAAESPFLFKN